MTREEQAIIFGITAIYKRAGGRIIRNGDKIKLSFNGESREIRGDESREHIKKEIYIQDNPKEYRPPKLKNKETKTKRELKSSGLNNFVKQEPLFHFHF